MTPDLCIQHPGSFWAHRRWPQFRDWPNKDQTLVLCPVTSFSDWELGHALDAEEHLLLGLLKEAGERKPDHLQWLTLPPCRFTAGAHKRTAFPVPQSLAFRQLEDWGRSVAESGFSRLVFVNSSPFNEDLVDACGRDLRIELGLQTFVVNLSGLGLDLHPRAPEDRRRAQTLVTAISGHPPGKKRPSPPSSPTLPPGIAADWMTPDWAMPEPVPLEAVHATATALLTSAADHFIRLATEIRDRPPLAPAAPRRTPE